MVGAEDAIPEHEGAAAEVREPVLLGGRVMHQVPGPAAEEVEPEAPQRAAEGPVVRGLRVVEDLGEGPAVLKEWVEGLTSQEVVDKLVPVSIPVAPVLQINQAIDDPHVKARGIIAEVDHHTAGKVRMPGFPVKMSKSPASIRMGAPKLGEHSAEVLKEYLGYTDEQIAELKSLGIVI